MFVLQKDLPNVRLREEPHDVAGSLAQSPAQSIAQSLAQSLAAQSLAQRLVLEMNKLYSCWRFVRFITRLLLLYCVFFVP